MEPRIVETVRRTLDRLEVVGRLHRVAIGVSGGADSTALALLLHRILAPRGVGLVLAHVDHTLPEAETPEDGAFVWALAERLGAPFEERCVRVREAMALTGESLEMAARRLRHEALRDIARTAGADAIALGHNADDQVETMLLRLVRGTGPRGLGGMPEWLPSPDGGPGLLRPLLGCSREEIRVWLREEGETWREDPTNAVADVQRNRLRLRVLPALYEALGEGARQGFLNTAALLRDEEAQWLGPLVGETLELCRAGDGDRLPRDRDRLSTGGNGDRLLADRLRSLSPPLRRRVLLRELQRAGLPQEYQTGALLDRLAAFAVRPDAGSATLDIGAGYCAKRVYGVFHIVAPKGQTLPFAEGQTPLSLGDRLPQDHGDRLPCFSPNPSEDRGQTPQKREGQTPVPASGGRGQTLPQTGKWEGQTSARGASVLRIEAAIGFERTERKGLLDRPQTAYLSRKEVPNLEMLVVRRIRPGDRLQTIGAAGARKISDILVDRKAPRGLRGEVEVVCAGDRVAWLPGHSVDAAFAVESMTAPSWKCILG